MRTTVAPAPLELSLSLLGGLLVDALKNGLGSRLNEVLGLLQTEGGQGAHLLDDTNLPVADSLENDVELVLLFSLFSGSAGGSSNGNGGRGSKR